MIVVVGSRSDEEVFEDHCGQIVKRSQMSKDGSSDKCSLRSWRDLARESFCFGSEAVRGLVKSRVEFPPAQIRGVF